MIDIHWLKTFVTLARLKHFSKTAVELNMTQPNVSLHIKQLEQCTHSKLLERSPFSLTYAGKRLLQSAQLTLLELQLCQSDLNAINDLSQGTLCIAASDSISRLLLIAPLQSFKRDYPGIDLSVLNTTSARAAQWVKSAEVDLGFVMAQKTSQPLYYTELQQLTWCAVGDDLLNKNKTDDCNEQATLILLGHDTRTREIIDPALAQFGISKYRIMEVSSVDAQIDWAQAGFGTAIVPDYSLLTRDKVTVKVTPLPDFPITSLGYVVRQNQILSAATKQLLRWIEEGIVGRNT